MRHVGDSSITDCNLEVNVAGQGQEATVGSGETVSLAYSGNVWSHPGCPACIDQVVIGVEGEPLFCAYNGIPDVYPGRTFSGSYGFRAPTERGVYRIYGFVASQYSCEDAKRMYREHPEARFQVGTLAVEVAPPPAPPPWQLMAQFFAAVLPVAFVSAVMLYNEAVKGG